MTADRDLAEIERSSIFVFIAVVAFVLLFLSLTTLGIGLLLQNVVPQETQQSLGTPIEIVSIVANILLSLGLIWIYLRIRNIQRDQEGWMEEQTEIQNRQRKLMEAQYKPLVTCNEERADGDDIIFTATNDGEGIAQRIVLSLEVFVSQTNVGPAPPRTLDRSKMTKITEITDHAPVEDEDIQKRFGANEYNIIYSASVGRTKYDTSEDKSSSSPVVIEPHDSKRLRVNLRLLFDGGIAPEITPETTSEFSAATEELSKHGHTAIGYRIRYSYQNILDETVEEDKILSSGAAVLEPGQDFEEIYKRSGGRIGTLEPKFFRTEREHVVFFN